MTWKVHLMKGEMEWRGVCPKGRGEGMGRQSNKNQNRPTIGLRLSLAAFDGGAGAFMFSVTSAAASSLFFVRRSVQKFVMSLIPFFSILPHLAAASLCLLLFSLFSLQGKYYLIQDWLITESDGNGAKNSKPIKKNTLITCLKVDDKMYNKNSIIS